MNNQEISINTATNLLRESKSPFTEVFKHGTLVVEFYKPDKVDHQKPHDRDEIYVIADGTGIFSEEKDGISNPAIFSLCGLGLNIDLRSLRKVFRHGASFTGLWVEKMKTETENYEAVATNDFLGNVNPILRFNPTFIILPSTA